jgi:hypothetical protein
VCRTPFHHAGPQQEEDAPLHAKALQIGVSRRPVLAVVVDALRDAQRRQHGRVERDGTIDIAHRYKDMIEHGENPPVQML